MSTEQVLCSFKNLKVHSNGSKILTENLNKVLNTTSFNIIEEWGARENQCELGCSRDEADYIREHLSDLVTSRCRSIWFSFRPKANDYRSESNQFNAYKNPTHKGWLALYNLGSMLDYSRFVGHILSDRCPVIVKIHKDAQGRLKNIVLEICYTTYQMVFDLNLFHNDILINYGQDNNNEPIEIVLMMKGLPHIKKRLSDGECIRICDSTRHKIDINTISQCSDLHLQFDQRSDAKDFLRELSNMKSATQFTFNYADFQFESSSNDRNASKLLNSIRSSSEWSFYSMQMLSSLGFVFLDKYLSNERIQSTFASWQQKSPEKFYDICCALWARLRENHCCSILDVFNDPNIINTRENTYQVPHVIVTPLRMLFQPMHSTSGHRAMRRYGDKSVFRWMLVYFRDEDQVDKITNVSENDELRDRYQHVLQDGLSSAGQNLIYYYFGSSGSQMKKQEFWFLAPVNNKSEDTGMAVVDKARLALGDLKNIRNVATFIARVGLYLTTSKPTDIKLTYVGKSDSLVSKIIPRIVSSFNIPISIRSLGNQTEAKAYLIEDIEHDGHCFTDGIGRISLSLAKKVALSNGIHISRDEDIPSAFQVRVAGCKGMLSIDPCSTKDDYIKVRNSMMKFTSDDWILEIVDHSRIMCLSLNNQIIRLLCDLNPENEAVIESLQNRCILQGQWHPPEEAYFSVLDTRDIDRKKDEFRRHGYINAKDFLRRNRIPLPVDEARCLFGIADETKSLREGQCFIQYQTMDKKSYKVVTGEVIVTKNPCLYPGDIRRLQAVDIPALRRFIRDCIVFPVLGSRPHSNEISGSDLDGDQYWVYWGNELKIKQMMPPLAYTPAEKKLVVEVTPQLIIDHILDTLDDQTSGIICNTHSVIADRDANGTKSADCRYLAELFPRAIDSIKTGEHINMEHVYDLREKYCREYPTWMMKKEKPSYKTETINARLFDKAQNLRIDGSAYRFLYKKYDNISEDVVINMEGDIDTNRLLISPNENSNSYRVPLPSKPGASFCYKHKLKAVILSWLICFMVYAVVKIFFN